MPVRERPIPDATGGRLPVYLRALVEMAEQGSSTVSSEELADAAGVNSAKVRKDLSHLGTYGTRGVGYDVAYLIHQIRRELGLTQHWPVVIVGVGNLGHALANYRGFGERGFRVVALADSDRGKVGERVNGLVVRHVDDLPDVVRDEDVAIGVICTPATAAQEVAERMVAAGIQSILNFAPSVISVPAAASVGKGDLAIVAQAPAVLGLRMAGLAVRGGRRPAPVRGGHGDRLDGGRGAPDPGPGTRGVEAFEPGGRGDAAPRFVGRASGAARSPGPGRDRDRSAPGGDGGGRG